MERLVELKLDNPVSIIDGYATIDLPQFSLRIIQRVKQTKGRGTADADQLKELNHYHKDIMPVLIAKYNENRVWTVNDLLNAVKFHLSQIDTEKYSKFNPNHWRRPVSELLRKGILFHYKDSKRQYQVDFNKARKALETGVFE